MATKIIIDSTVDSIDKFENQTAIVPLSIHFGEEEYIDGVTIDHKMFYDKLIETDVFPSTSQATPFAFAQEFERVVAAGDEAVVITIASELSGTYQSAVTAARDFEGIYVVDSSTATIGAGCLLEYALQLVEEGMSAADIAQELERVKDRIIIVALLDTLEYLKRGGRISATVAFAGGLLKIKPVVALKNGVIEVLGKARGSKQGKNLLVQQIQACGGVDFDMPVMLGYTGLSDDVLLKYKEDSRYLWESYRDDLNHTSVGSVVGTHVGPGAIAVAFFRN